MPQPSAAAKREAIESRRSESACPSRARLAGLCEVGPEGAEIWAISSAAGQRTSRAALPPAVPGVTRVGLTNVLSALSAPFPLTVP